MRTLLALVSIDIEVVLAAFGAENVRPISKAMLFN